MRTTLFAFAAGVVFAAGGQAFAQHDGHAGHSGQPTNEADAGDMLASSNPADGAVLAESPRTLALAFAHPVILQTVAVTGPDGAPVRATFRRPSGATAAYSVALPQLAPGVYQARWTASGMGHEMSGTLGFTVQ